MLNETENSSLNKQKAVVIAFFFIKYHCAGLFSKKQNSLYPSLTIVGFFGFASVQISFSSFSNEFPAEYMLLPRFNGFTIFQVCLKGIIKCQFEHRRMICLL